MRKALALALLSALASEPAVPQADAPVCTDPGPQAQDFAFAGEHCQGCLGADLELTVSDGTPSTAKGATITYKLTYANRGADSATGVVLTATVPANTTFDPTASASGWQRVGTSSTYTLSIPELKPGQEVSVLFAVKVSTTVPVGTVLSFSASIADDSLHGPDKVPADNAVADDNLVTSGPTTVCGSITSDTLWKALDGPFIVTCEVVVPAGVTLTLEPGVVVKFNSALGIQVLGSLVAQGTQSRGILFTSNRSRLRRGDWDGIGIGNGGTALLDWATVEYGGLVSGPWDANVQVAQGGSLTLAHSIVRSSDEYGLWNANGQAIVEDSLFTDHDNVAVYVQTNSPANPTRVVRNTFSSNRSYPVAVEYADGATAEIGENGGSGNKFASVRVSGTLSGDVAWALNPGLPYLVSGDLTVTRRGKLSLGPGIVVKLETAASDLFVDGTLAAEGSEAAPVVFTSFKDDAAGGDTNGDGAATGPAAGDWGQIRFNPGSRASRLDHAVVAYGASSASAAPGQVRIDSEGVSVSDSAFRSSRQAGLHVTGAMSLVRGSRFEGNLTHGLHVALTSNRGLIVEGNTFLGNGQHAMLLDLAHARGGLTLQGNAATGNQTNGVALQGDVAGGLAIDTSAQSGFALRLIGDLTVGAGGTLTLSPGTVVKASAAAVDLLVNGSLIADGTLARRIVFTSFKDDSFGGDTNGDGSASAPAAGDWGQVWLRTGSSGSVLRNAVLAYGGATGQPETFATLRTDTPGFLVTDTTVRRSRQHGIYAASTSLSLVRVTVENSSSSGLHVNALTGTVDMKLEGSSFLANAQHAVFLDLQGVTGKVVAQGNTASGNGTNGVAVQGFFVGPFLFEWTGQSSFALRLAADLTVQAGAALTLSPGVVVKGGAADHELRVEGSLIARGTAVRPVVFTSIKDDSAGGDTNGDGSASSPAAGDWGQVWLRPGSTGSVLEETVLAWGGATGVADVLGNLRVDAGSFSLVGGAVRRSKQHGIYAHRSSGEILDVDIEDNAQTGAFFNDLAGSIEVTLEDNRFLRNGDHAAFLDLEATAGTIAVRGNTATGNLTNGIGIQGLVGGPLTLDWSGQTDLPLRLNADVTVRSGAVFTLSPGTVVKAGSPQHDLIVDGSLVARGTAAQPVVFTSLKDDSRGGDTNRDGAASAPAAGDWGQVWLRAASSDNVLEHCVLAYGGAVNVAETLGDLRIDTPNVSATSCTFERSRQSGVHLTANPPPPLFSGNRLQGNTGNGLLHAGGGILDARNNWWGDPSGPFHPTLNPAGQGNRVSDNVLFDPWLTSPDGAPPAPPSPLLEPQPAPQTAPAPVAALAARSPAPAYVTVPLATAAMAAVMVAAPPRPSSFFGRITVGGNALVPPGTRVSAWIGGIPYAETFSLLSGNESVYRFDVPGDVESTSAIEGGRPGETIVFRVAGVAVPQTAVWQDGLYRQLDLTAAIGPDLSVAKTDGRDQAAPGDTITYTLTVTNLGEGTASGVAVRDTLPDGTTFVSASNGGTTAGRVVTWPAFDLADGASVTRTVSVRVAASLPPGAEALVNTVTVADDGAHGVDSDPANNAAQDSDALDAAPDLAITKTDGLAEVLPGTTLRYILTITNRGSQGATGVRVTDTLPEHLTFFAASDSGAESGLTIAWPPFDLAAGATVKREISGRVNAPLPADLTALVNTASVTDDGANGADPNPADNSATDTDTVLRKPDLTVSEVDAGQARLDLESLALAGDVLLQLRNQGTLEAAAPFEVTVFEDADGDGAWTAGTDNLLGHQTYGVPLAAGQSVPFAVPVSGTVAFRGNRIFAFADSAAAVDELSETNNVGSTAGGCETVPVIGAFEPELEILWPRPGIVAPFSVDSASSPVVVNLTDDNGDGKIDGQDVPAIVFTTANTDPPLGIYQPSFLRAIRGDTGEAIFDVQAFFNGFRFYEFALATVAAGDIDLDGKPEIITSNVGITAAFGPVNAITAYEHDGRRKWRSPDYSTHPAGSWTNRDNPTIADIDRDGMPEIIVGAHVFNSNNGTLRWKGTGGQAFQSILNANGGASGAISIVADLDLTGNPEIVTGNTAYRSDGSIYWQIPYDDGYPAVANFDADPFPEIVVVAKGKVRLHEHDGTLKWGPIVLPGKTPVAGGPPTVADFDADGQPEIGVASSDFYVVLETDGTVKWQRKTQDFSSGMTGSTVFDFDGDGRFEVVYRDEVFLRIYRGEDGTVLAQFPVNSSTLNEEPTVADVDRDGNAEILVTSDHGSNETGIPGNANNAGLRVFGDANDNWVGTRAIWNQHAYSVGNVNDDATIPRDPDWSWLSHNTYRAQVAPPGVAFSAPDLTASRGRVDVSDFPRSLRITARIGNGGSTTVAPGLSVAFYSGDPAAGGTLLGIAIVGRLAPGGFEDVSFTWTSPPQQPATVWIVADGEGRERECDEANNVYAFAYSLADVGLILRKDDGRISVRFADETTYTLTIDNFAPLAATGVALTDVLPPHTTFVSASDGGTVSAGIVTWPPFTLESGARATRVVTIRVVDTVPTGVDTLTNTASVTDDGSHGPDPTPGNNTASDTNELLAFRAEAGGPYSGGEGEPIALDASGTADPESRIVRYEWDLDGDGAFDDATGTTATAVFPDQGVYTVVLRVTDAAGRSDTDTAEVTVANRPPAVDAGDDRTVLEGDRLSLSVPFTDPGAADTHTAVIDWGDGAFDPGTIAAGRVLGNHIYPDDANAEVRVCVTDDDGDTGCDAIQVSVRNQNPVVQGAGAFALAAWRPEDYLSCYDGFSDWQVDAGGGAVTQGNNSRPSLFYGNFLALGSRIEGRLHVSSGTSDGDAFGLAIGFLPGDTTSPAADYLLIDWRREEQSFRFGCGGQATARRGLALSRVSGVPADAELWAHDNRACNGTASGVRELARGKRFGSTGWTPGTEYTFALEASPDRLRLFINGVLELDVTGSFPNGRLAFYGYSQADVTYSGFSIKSIVGDEGRPLEARVGFTDAGVLDSHTATIDWGDGTPPSPGTIAEVAGFDVITGSHSFPDDGSFTVRVCATDDDGGTGCDDVPATVRNLAPVVEAGEKVLVDPGQPVTVNATFTDAGRADTHTATIDWGDGAQQAGAVTQGSGFGTVSGSHTFAEEGTFVIEVCVTDDDEETGCDSFQANGVLDLGLTKTHDAGTLVAPGQVITYTLTANLEGTLSASGVKVVDTLSDLTNFVSAGQGGVYDPQAHTVTWSLGTLEPGQSVPLTVTVQADFVLPVGAVLSNSAAISYDGGQGPNVKPGDTGDDQGGATVRTPPDLVVRSLDRGATVTDAVALALTGTLGVEIANQGGLDVAAPFRVTVFADLDLDRAFTPGTDRVFGEAEVTSAVSAGAAMTVPVAVEGAVEFRDAPIWAFVDSGAAITEVDETNNLRNTGEACLVTGEIGRRIYTTDADFDQGVLFNVNHDAPNHDELRLNRITEPFPFLWVAASARGTAVKINTVTGQILGEYYTAPNNRGRDPSRTTVDLNGDAWVANRAENSVVHIGLKEAFQCIDRNGNGVIDTSAGLGDIRPWPNTGGADNNGGVSTAADECIIHYVRVNGTGTRTVAITADNDLWVGGLNNQRHDLIDGETGTILDSIAPPCGGYGGLIDRQGVLWSASGLLRYDPRTGQMDCLASIWNSYGLGLDSQGRIWNTQADAGTVTVLSPTGEILDVFPTGGSVSTGLAITPDDNVWIANRGPHTVTRLSNEGDLLATIPVGNTPTGVAVDTNGKVWATNLGSNNVMRIDPATNKVDLTVSLGPGAGPYNYSDMTGAVVLGKTAPQGHWTVNHDSGQAGTKWGRVRWSSYEPPGSSVIVRARSAEAIGGLAAKEFHDVEKGIESGVPDGRYLQVEVTLHPSPAGETPIVYDVTAETRSGLPDLTASFVRMVHRSDSIELTVRVGNGGDARSPAGTPVSLYDGDPAAGGARIATFTDLFPLAPGEYQDVPFLWTSPPPGIHQLHLIANDDGTGQNRGPVEECTRANNAQVVEVAPLPDLVIPSIDRSTAATDLQALTISGTLGIGLKNQGNTSVAAPFRVTVFVDLDRDGLFTAAADRVLGQKDFTGSLAANATATLTVPVSGEVRFRDDLISAFVDNEGVIPELSEDNNLNQTGAACDFHPPVGSFSPQVEWQWTGSMTLSASNQVIMTPVVIDLTGDGVPEVIFTTYQGSNYNTDGHLRAVDGRTGAELFTVTDSTFDVRGAGAVAVGDVDLDGRPEIFAVAESGDRILAFEHDGTFKWRSAVLPVNVNLGGPALADLDRDGTPEIVVGATVLNNDGTRRWTGAFGRGDNTWGPLSLVADLDLSGNPEIVAGNTVYRSDGTVLWRRSDLGDGFNAVGNFDADPFPEVVLVTNGRVYLLQHDGTTAWGPIFLPGGGLGGAPTIADVDGDGQPEIGVAGASRYVIFETNGTIKWQAVTQDGSSHVTGSSVFDFEGDGRAEIVYGDEKFLRIYRGTDGTVLYQLAKSSGTGYELPVVADVDADGNAEIVAVANTLAGFGPQFGVYVIGDAADSWVPTRKLWNQHTYHVTNVNDDGSIPRREEPSWRTHNTYRLNLRTDGDALAAPDLTASRIIVDLANPGVEVPITARVGNGGKIFAPAGMAVAFYNGNPSAGGTLLGTAATTRRLEPGEFEDVSFVWRAPPPAPGSYTVFIVVDPVVAPNTGRGKVSECNEANNAHSHTFTVPTVPDLALAKDDGRSSAVPGQTIIYTLTVRNVGARDATGVTLTDALPQNTTFVSASDGGVLAAGTVTWPPFSVASGASVIRTLSVRINRPLPVGVTQITNQAAVADDGTGAPDPNPANNTATDVDSLRNAPEAEDDVATTPEDTAVEINLFANDADADGDPLTLFSFTQPAHGTVAVVTVGGVGAMGRMIYSPVANFHGTDTFTYVVSDGTGGTDTATVTVTVTPVNDPPVALNDLGETDRDVPLVLNLLANDSDVDGDTLSFLSPPQPFGGTLTLNADGTETYTPAPGFFGVDVFVYTITDGKGATDSATVTVNVKVTDEESPTILISGVTFGECKNQNVVPVISIADEHPGSQSITLNGQPFVSGTHVTADGDYTLVATATDVAGNTATQTVAFTIDKTVPAVTVTGVPANQCVNVPVTPVFQATDTHLGVVSASLNGVVFASGTVVSADGDYTLSVEAADTCGNSSAQTLAWTIDTVPPGITVAGVPEGQIVNVDVTPVIDVIDTHLGPVAITLDGVPFTSGTAVSAEGEHTLQIQAADTCGNSGARRLTFTIDKTPPGLAITGVVDGACGNADVTPVVTATDTHFAGVEVTLDGVPFASGTAVTTEGDYSLVAVAFDAAGNTARQERRFTIDKTAPAITLEGVVDGAIVNATVTPVFSATDQHPGSVTATLNDQPFTSGSAVTAEGDYTLVVMATDTCGNSSSQTVRFTIDATPPAITITGVSESCGNEDVTPVFSATDAHLETVAAALNGQPFTSGTVVAAEGDYTLQIQASDRAGNSSSETRTFTIDKTDPAISLTGATDGVLVNTDVTPVFTVTDTHLDTVTATLNGTSFTSGTAVGAEGSHVLIVTATDTCGNSSSQTVRFRIDKTPPFIAITGVPEECLNVDVTPVFSATDLHLDTVSATLDGQPFTSGTAVTAQGDHTLRIDAADQAGNLSTETRTFTIDKTDPAITLTGVTDGAVVNTDLTPVFTATDAHLSTVTATLNGAAYTSGTTITAEGDYRLVVTATDTCGNNSSRTVLFTIDKTPQGISITGVPEVCWNEDVTPVFTATDIQSLTATLNGQPFTSGTAVTVEGDYTLRVVVTDAAGNTSTETRTFTIDKTAPAITLAGVADGAIVNTDVTPVFSATDPHLSAVAATLNGAPFPSGTAVSAEGSYTLVITATDTCGNSSSRTVRFTIDRTPPAITIAGVPGGCVNVAVATVFTVTDLHPDTMTATLNGQPFASGTAITAEGGYTLRVEATDEARNTSTETRTFTIDETAPALTVTGAVDGAIVNTGVTPAFSATDLHLGAVTATLNGAPFASGTAVSAAGSYTLVVTATDTCGNNSSQKVRFTIDTTPPAITVAGVPQGCTNADVTPVFSAMDVHLDTVAATLNGQPFTSGTPITAEGDFTLRIEATDRAGNSSVQVRTFTIDKAAPVITLAGVMDGATVTTSVTPVFSATDSHLERVTATLNGAPFASGTVVSAAGDYTLVITATDTCGNSSSRTVRFTVAGPCGLYPIALHTSTLAGVEPGATLPDIFNGSQPGNFGWLTWTGASDVPSLVVSLTPPGNSGAYTNPKDSSDHVVSVDDWVQGRPGVENASEVRDALDTLKTLDIVVPVWDVATGQGGNTKYHVAGFARIRILDYRLPSENRITVRFLGLAKCGG